MKHPLSAADLHDQINWVMALGAIVIGLLIAFDATLSIAPESMRETLEYALLATKVLGALGVAYLLLLMLRKWRGVHGGDASPGEGFTVGVVRKACAASWLVTLLAVFLGGPRISHLPTQFVLDTIFAVLLISYGVAYLLFDRFSVVGEAEDL